MFEPLPQSFYLPSAKVVSPRLLGHWLIRRTKDGFAGGPIVETEAYLVGDPASHGFAGETARTRVMYGPPGFGYVYFIYGVHCCVNAVCRPPGHAEAILIRALDAEIGIDWMRLNRPVDNNIALTNGPGKLCAALKIDRNLNGVDLCSLESPLFIARNPNWKSYRQKFGPTVITQRIGITKAADLELRYYLDKSPFISRRVKAADR